MILPIIKGSRWNLYHIARSTPHLVMPENNSPSSGPAYRQREGSSKVAWPNKPLFSPLFGDAVFPLIARLFISAIFIQGALGKIMGWSGQAAYMQSHHLPGQLIPTMLGIALVIEAAGVLCLIVGWQVRAAAFVMCVYLGVVSVLLHNFWAAQGMAAGGMQTQFFKNIGIMGGLLMIAAHGPGKWSVDEVYAPAILSHTVTDSPQ